MRDNNATLDLVAKIRPLNSTKYCRSMNNKDSHSWYSRFSPVLVLTIPLLFSFIISAKATSFSCKRTLSPAEKMVCSDEMLSALDDGMATAFIQAIKNPSTAAVVRSTQKMWLLQRDRCLSSSCMADAFRQRITELNGYSTSEAQKSLTFTLPVGNKIQFDSKQNNLTIVGLGGINTKQAFIEAQQTSRDSVDYCENWNVKGATPECIAQRTADVGTDLKVVGANCETGSFKSFHKKLLFVGRNSSYSSAGMDNQAEYNIKDQSTGEMLASDMASGYWESLAVYTALCPSSVNSDPVPNQSASAQTTTHEASAVDFTDIVNKYANATSLSAENIKRQNIGSLVQGKGQVDDISRCGTFTSSELSECFEVTLHEVITASDYQAIGRGLGEQGQIDPSIAPLLTTPIKDRQIKLHIPVSDKMQSQLSSFKTGEIMSFSSCKITDFQEVLGFVIVYCDIIRSTD